MTASAGAMRLDSLGDNAEALTVVGRPQAGLAFEPETFFLGCTEGAGVVRDSFGRIARRCYIRTEGVYSPSQAAIRFDEVFTFDNGEVDVWRWAMTPGRDGRYVAAEAKAGAGITGERHGEDYLIAFRRPMGPAKGVFSPLYRSRFTLLSPDLALKRANVSLFGAPLGSLSAIHRRVS